MGDSLPLGAPAAYLGDSHWSAHLPYPYWTFVLFPPVSVLPNEVVCSLFHRMAFQIAKETSLASPEFFLLKRMARYYEHFSHAPLSPEVALFQMGLLLSKSLFRPEAQRTQSYHCCSCSKNWSKIKAYQDLCICICLLIWPLTFASKTCTCYSILKSQPNIKNPLGFLIDVPCLLSVELAWALTTGIYIYLFTFMVSNLVY